MKKLLASVALAALMAASGSASAFNVGFATVVNSECYIPGSGTTQTRGFTLDGTGAVASGGYSSLFTLTATCTGSAHVEITSLNGAITPGGAPAPMPDISGTGFQNHLKYSVKANWNGADTIVNAFNVLPNTIAIGASSGVPTSGPIALAFSTPGTGGLPLIAGTYSDTIVVKLLAN